MAHALGDHFAVEALNEAGFRSRTFLSSHTLLHMIVGEDDDGKPYQFLHLCLASNYVGEQLWDRY